MEYKIIISNRAIDDLRDLVLYASHERPEATKRLAYALIERTRGLKDFPRLGKVVREFGDADVRELVLHPFRIVYRIDDVAGVIGVARYWHGARGYLSSGDLRDSA